MGGAEIVVIGGGIVGLAVAYGLSGAGSEVVVLDEGDIAIRASRANFGLVWTQTKGLQYRPYASLSRQAARLWPDFAARLRADAGIDVGLEQSGGVKLCHSEEELDAYGRLLARQFDHDIPEPNAYQMWDRVQLRQVFPEIGPKVVGAGYCRLDGAVSPMRFYRALLMAVKRRGVRVIPNMRVLGVSAAPGAYAVHAEGGDQAAARVVLAAGLGNARLGERVGLSLSLHPIRGQLLVTQRLRRIIPIPTHVIRQTEDDTVIIGDSKEAVGLDDGTETTVMGDIASRALESFPGLADVSVIRAWSGLRIMTPDGAPIYAQSPTHPGVFSVNVHSGVTLAPIHAGLVADWIRTGRAPASITPFSDERPDAQAA